MRPGSTPTFSFELPREVDPSTLKNAKAIFAINNKKILQKYLSDFQVDGQKLSFRMTQQETFMFARNVPIEIQFRAITLSGEALVSDIFKTIASRCLDDEVLE